MEPKTRVSTSKFAAPGHGAAHVPLLARLLPADLSVTPLRVSSQAKMSVLISFALAHLFDPSNPPIAIHSFSNPESSATQSGPSTSTPVLDSALPPAPAPAPAPDPIPAAKPGKASSPSSAVLPKLVSVVEIIKRTFLPPKDATVSPGMMDGGGKGKGKEVEILAAERAQACRVSGLHQYSRLGALEEMGFGKVEVDGDREAEEEDARQANVALNWINSGGGGTKRFALYRLQCRISRNAGSHKSGRPKRKHTPYLVIILSTTLIPFLEELGFSYQPPLPPPEVTKPSRAAAEGEAEPAKKRRKRKSKRTAGEQVAVAETTAMSVSGRRT
ncbi:hypothetical protein P7C70_g1392, partial [Phenoliferia sp. Uapishka_3]